MTRDEVIRLAQQYCDYSSDSKGRESFEFDDYGLYHFAQLVAAEYKQDAERLDFIEKEMNYKIHRIGDRWYWSRARHRTYYCEGGLRDAIDAAMEKVK